MSLMIPKIQYRTTENFDLYTVSCSIKMNIKF